MNNYWSIEVEELRKLESAAEVKIRDKMYTQAMQSLVEEIDKDIITRMIQVARHQAEAKFKELSNKEALSPEEEKEMSEVFTDLL